MYLLSKKNDPAMEGRGGSRCVPIVVKKRKRKKNIYIESCFLGIRLILSFDIKKKKKKNKIEIYSPVCAPDTLKYVVIF